MACEQFLNDKAPVAAATINWESDGLRFDVAAYLDPDLPPHDLVTSVRAVVTLDGKVVMLTNEGERHYLPGGRVESGEDYIESLEREIEEECGLKPLAVSRLGFMHFHHLNPRPKNYAYPYPDMFQLIYTVQGKGEIRSGDLDGYEESAVLMSPHEAARVADETIGLPFLRLASGT